MFKDNLLALRKRANMTQAEAAKALGISRSSLSMYEVGLREPDFETLENIARYFGVNMADLISGSEETKFETLQYKYQEYVNDMREHEPVMSPEKKAVLEAVDKMSREQMIQLLKIIDAITGK